MLKFFIELYVNIIDCYNHLAPDDKKADDVEESHSSHYIITICDPSTDPPIATYDKLFMETNLQEGYFSNEIDADAKMSTLTQTTTPSQQSQQSQHSQHSQTSNKTRQTLEEINFQEPLMLTNMVIEDYYVVEDHDDEWELIEQRP
jgi:hypothetical protein